MDRPFVVVLLVAGLLGWLLVPGAVVTAGASEGIAIELAGPGGLDAPAIERVRAGVATGGPSRVDTDGVLEQATRADVYDVIERMPGTTLAEVASAVGIAKSTARYHVDVLRRAGLVGVVTVGGTHRFAPGEADAELAAALRAEATGPVLRAVAANEPASVREVAAATDRAQSTVSHHLSRLEDRGLVERERDGQAVTTTLAAATRDALSGRTVGPTSDVAAGSLGD